MKLKAPFPYFGGKSSVAALVWSRFGQVRNYVEPFCGSCAVLLNRPQPFEGTETINDLDGLLTNAWRAIRLAPETVAEWCDAPVVECDMHAKHVWLVEHKDALIAKLEGDPDFFDAKAAGYWIHGTCCWIGAGFCSGNGPWGVEDVDGVRQLVHLRGAGRGVKRPLVHLGDAGQGVNRQLVHLGNAGQDSEPQASGIYAWMQALAERLARVRVCCGDWSRVCGPTPTVKQGLTAVFLDPPYSAEAGRDENIYNCDCLKVAHDVAAWAIEQGDDKRMRICLAGYEGEHDMPSSWDCVAWKAHGGYGARSGDNENANKERLWFSPHCVNAERMLFP